MATWKCNSCGGIYRDTMSDGMLYFHVCNSEIVEPAEFDATGKQTKPERRVPRDNVRDERPDPSVFKIDDAYFRAVPNPEERNRFLFVPATPRIISEGPGRTPV